jgi:hypothetical protein
VLWSCRRNCIIIIILNKAAEAAATAGAEKQQQEQQQQCRIDNSARRLEGPQPAGTQQQSN